MVKNKATVEKTAGGAQFVRVNERNVYLMGDPDRANLMAERLNRIFQDRDRDLDFLTPTLIPPEGDKGLRYGIICPTVRRKTGHTYMHPRGKIKSLDRDIYAHDPWRDSDDPRKQTAVIEFLPHDTPVPWVVGLQIANNIRRSIALNFPDVSGMRKHPERCYLLHTPHNQSHEVEAVIGEKVYCAVYAHPCQGRGPGVRSPKCGMLPYPPENILNPFTMYYQDPDEFEILHANDLTCALTPSRGWYDKYKNHFVRVTNLENNASVVVRVTDRAPAKMGVELTYAAWKAIGEPLGVGSVKLELLGS